MFRFQNDNKTQLTPNFEAIRISLGIARKNQIVVARRSYQAGNDQLPHL